MSYVSWTWDLGWSGGGGGDVASEQLKRKLLKSFVTSFGYLGLTEKLIRGGGGVGGNVRIISILCFTTPHL